ncbi:ATP-binding protein [Phytohalomonas tamaricis]|uniref:ATP-binding protein n=1 Tax=Phytohalomonas tamaricis TaxID=2081032 RepID=UPI00131A0281|nr:ATP-binding protein [Phytohalomonas tamaricis]
MDSFHISLVTTLVERIGLGLIIFDQNLRVQYWNGFITQCSGMLLEQAQGQPLNSIFPDADTAHFQQMIEQTRSQSGHIYMPWSNARRLIQLPFGLPPEQASLFQSWLLFPFFNEENTPNFALVLYSTSDRVKSNTLQSLKASVQDNSRTEQEELIEKLKKANDQLLQSEKLAAIGQLAAGVAHEINNPIGYVSSNLKSLVSYVQDLLHIIDAVDDAANIEELRQLKRSVEYEYIRSDIMALINESEDGLDRVKKIITSLKDFSHIEEDEFRLADLHHGIDTTLSVVKSELKYKAEVTKEYGELPEVECIPSQINQVVMNLLVNAAHAIEQFGRITLRTGHGDGWVWFEVEDTGTGIAPNLLNRIFEPFFTTKPVGKGTGLGLSLSYSIIQKHHGRIKAFSEIGQGTRFRVWLPIRQSVMPDNIQDNEMQP